MVQINFACGWVTTTATNKLIRIPPQIFSDSKEELLCGLHHLYLHSKINYQNYSFQKAVFNADRLMYLQDVQGCGSPFCFLQTPLVILKAHFE